MFLRVLNAFGRIAPLVALARGRAWAWSLPLLLVLWQGQALAQDHVVERAWVDDPGGRLTLQEVQARPAQAYRGVLSRGFGTSVIWVRLRIDPQAWPEPGRERERLVLRIRPVYLDEILVFDPLAAGGTAGITGDTYHPRDEDIEGLDFLMPIARGQAPRDIWLRVASTSTRQIDVGAYNTTDLNRLSRSQQLLYAGYIGLILVIAVWALAHWLVNRETVIGAFGLAQVGAFVYSLSSLGYLRILWPEAWPAVYLSHATTLGSIFAVSAGLIFHITLIREFDPPSVIRRGLWLLPSLLPAKLMLVLLGHTVVALRINMLEILGAPLVFLAAACLSRGWAQADARLRPALSRPVVLSFYALLVVVLGLAAVPGLGLAAGSEVSLHIVQAHGLLTAFLILVMLQYRAHVVNRRQQETAVALELSQLQARQERSIRKEQEKLLTMLAHELKTSLSVMHLRLDAQAPGSREIKQAIRDMGGVIDRCLQSIELEDRRLQVRLQPCDLSGLVRDAVSGCAQPARVRVQAPAQLPAMTDGQLLSLVLNSLLENACKYAAPDTPIHIHVSVCDSAQDAAGERLATLELRNQPGAAGRPDPGRVFEKYYRSPHARRQAGTGLGLYLVRHILKTLGATIRYEPDDASVGFVVRLPLGRAV